MKTKAIAEGAIFCALAVVFALICYYVPFLVLFYFFIPVPIIVLAQKQGFKVALIASIAATLILLFLVDPIMAAVYGMYMIFMGCALGYVYFKKKDGFVRLFVGCFGAFIVLALMFIIFWAMTGTNGVEAIIQSFDAISKEAMEIYKNSGMLSGDQMNQMQGMFDTMINSMKLAIPVTVIVIPFFISWANIVVADVLLKRMRVNSVPLKRLSEWRLPASFKTFLIIIIIAVLIIDIFKIEAVPIIYTATLTNIISLIYLVMGLSFVFWFMNRKRKKESMGLKVLVVIISLLLPMVTYVLTFAGVLDIYIDLRRMIEGKGGVA
ncbi:MAG: DUF2232 domain-containing protein [Eubacterium sp.]